MLLKNKVITSALLASLLTLTACSNSDTDATTTESDGEVTTQNSADVAPTAQTADPQQKLNAYVDCSNGTMSDLHKSYNRYTNWVKDMNAGPTGNESVVYGVYDLNESGVAACINDAVAATKLEPSLPELDDAVVAYAAAIKDFDEVTRKADKYYDQGNYKDDGFALGKELHPQLVSSYEAADKAAEAFDAQLEVFNSKAQNEQLAKLEQEEGRKFNYLALATSIKAKNMVDYITEEDFDVEKAKALIDDYEAIATELNSYIASDAEDTPSATIMIDDFSENLLVAAKQRMRHVRDKKTYSDSEINFMNTGSGWMVDGSPHKVIDNYNKFIDQLNRLN